MTFEKDHGKDKRGEYNPRSRRATKDQMKSDK